MLKDRSFLLTILSVLCLAMSLPFAGQVFLHDPSMGFDVFGFDGSCFYCVVPVSVGLLFLSPIMPATAKLLPRILLALWLALFLWSGSSRLFAQDYYINSWDWTAYLAYVLTLGIPLLVIASKKLAALGPIKLTVFSGFILMLVYDVFNLHYQYRPFYITDVMPDGSHWVSYAADWLGFSTWVSYRLITFIGLGYLIARRRGVIRGMFICMLVALADSQLGDLASITGLAHDLESVPSSLRLQFGWFDVWLVSLETVLVQVMYLSIFALAGAMITLIPWRRFLPTPVRFVPATKLRQGLIKRSSPSANLDQSDVRSRP